jgi:hypothetical protein
MLEPGSKRYPLSILVLCSVIQMRKIGEEKEGVEDI